MTKPDWSNICNRADTCALSGAAALFTGVPRAEVLVNGPLWCYFYALRYLENVDNDASRRFSGTQPDNNAIVFGTEKYILEALNRFKAEGRRADVLFIESSCALSLIGDDVAGIARKAALPYPVVTLSSGGVLGGFAEGFEKAATTLLDSLDLEAENAAGSNGNGGARHKPVVNILGLTPYYYNGKADACEILRLLKLAGLSVNVKLGCGSSFNEIRRVGAADLNVVVHAQLGLRTARYLQERLGTPFVCAGVPYGTEGTRAWLARIAEALRTLDAAVPPDMSPAYADCDKTRDYLYGWMNDFSSGWGELWYDRVLVSAPGSVALALADAVRGEWLDTAELTVICQNDMTESGIVSAQADRVLTAGRDGVEIGRTLREFHDGLVLGSSSEFSLLHRGRNCGVTRVGVAYPMLSEVNLIRVPYCGTRGAVRMLEKLANLHIQNKLAKQI